MKSMWRRRNYFEGCVATGISSNAKPSAIHPTGNPVRYFPWPLRSTASRRLASDRATNAPALSLGIAPAIACCGGRPVVRVVGEGPMEIRWSVHPDREQVWYSQSISQPVDQDSQSEIGWREDGWLGEVERMYVRESSSSSSSSSSSKSRK